jgi:hypothetical protein
MKEQLNCLFVNHEYRSNFIALQVVAIFNLKCFVVKSTVFQRLAAQIAYSAYVSAITPRLNILTMQE